MAARPSNENLWIFATQTTYQINIAYTLVYFFLEIPPAKTNKYPRTTTSTSKTVGNAGKSITLTPLIAAIAQDVAMICKKILFIPYLSTFHEHMY